MPASEERFRASFARWSQRVRARLALGRILTGAAWALALGAVVAGMFWWLADRVPFFAAARPWTSLAALVGGLGGLLVARARRWSDRDVALFLDGRLKTDETISTAVDLDRAEASEAHGVVITQADAALARATRRSLRAPLWSPPQLLLPAGAAAIAYLSWIPAPVPPVGEAAEPGEEMVQVTEITGLEKVMALSKLDARDEDQQRRFEDLAQRAEALRDQIRAGMPKREAQAEIAKLRDDLLAERMSLGAGDGQKGLEAALGKLGENADLSEAARALGNRDMVSFDREMQKLANEMERQSRDRAQQDLEEAADAARKAGAPDVASELEEQKQRLAQRGALSDDLRDLAEALGDDLGKEGAEAKEGMDAGDPEAAQRLAEALDEALGNLTEEEYERLKENLKRQQAERGEPPAGADAGEKPDLAELADRLDTPEGRKQLEQMLRDAAKASPSGESQRQEGLDDAQKGAGEAEGQLAPMPMAGGPGGAKSPGSPSPGPGGDSTKKGQDGGGPGGGGDPSKSGPKEGQTAAIESPGVVSHAPTPLNPGAPMPGSVVGRTDGRPGETANLAGNGALGTVGPGEVGAIERSEVPEEYREQVGRYFEP